MLYLTDRTDRALITVVGEDCSTFLQGLVTNDVMRLANEPAPSALAAGLLSPQGKVFADLLIARLSIAGLPEECLYLDVEALRAEDIKSRLNTYRLRAKVTLDTLDTAKVRLATLWSPNGDLSDYVERANLQGFFDPRASQLGYHLCLQKDNLDSEMKFEHAPLEDWREHRLRLGIAEGAEELGIEALPALSANLDQWHGIDWEKGCYIGQEVTARSHYRGLVKRRLVSLEIQKNLDPQHFKNVKLGSKPSLGPKTIIKQNNSKIGEVRSCSGAFSLAYLLTACLSEPLVAEDLDTGHTYSVAVVRP